MKLYGRLSAGRSRELTVTGQREVHASVETDTMRAELKLRDDGVLCLYFGRKDDPRDSSPDMRLVDDWDLKAEGELALLARLG